MMRLRALINRMKIKVLGVLLLMLIPLGNPLTFAANSDQGVSSKESRDLSQLEVSIGDEADILLVDPRGRRTGSDPIEKKIYEEIPQSAYSADFIGDRNTGGQVTGTHHAVMVRAPMPGLYRVTVTGLHQGRCTLSVFAVDREGNIQADEQHKGTCSINSKSMFQIAYDPAIGQEPVVTQLNK